MNINLKTHLLGMRSALYYYFLGVAVSWGGFPIICMIAMRLEITVDKMQMFYSIFATISYAILTYLGMYDIGARDRRPYKWARYKAKGAVMGLMAFVVLYIAEVIVIFVADKYAVVQHPLLDMTNIHGYVTQIMYMPFFWFYKLLYPNPIMPSVNYLTALAPVVFIVAVNGFAYWMGYNEKVIIRHKPQGKVAQFLFYGRRNKKKAKPNWQENLSDQINSKDNIRK